MQLSRFADEIWTYEGSKVRFYGFPFPTRMTVVRLNAGTLWIHSPEKLTDALQQELRELGEVAYLISPNKLHHLFLSKWIEAYPSARTYAAPGLVEKRRDITFDAALTEVTEAAWQSQIDQTIFRGSPAVEEVVFYHKPSRTLILTDLIENFDPDTLNWWQQALARFAGIVYPTGKTPIDWRLTFYFGSREQARQSLRTMLGWGAQNIILSHGKCIIGGATDYLKKSFAWLGKLD